MASPSRLRLGQGDRRQGGDRQPLRMRTEAEGAARERPGKVQKALGDVKEKVKGAL